MQIDRHDNNTFYIYLTREELGYMDINPATLSYGSADYRKLTSMVLRAIENEYGFTKTEQPLSIEMCPAEGGDLWLSVSEYQENEETDPRFSTFAVDEEDFKFIDDRDADELEDEGDYPEDADDFEQEVRASLASSMREKILPPEIAESSTPGGRAALIFENYDDLVNAISKVEVADFCGMSTNLYLASGRYYLCLKLPKKTDKVYRDLVFLLEYSRMIKYEKVETYLLEKGKLLIKDTAVEHLGA
ncbi:MAG: adaptor protein MecA [Lachnospiraceae bacterium]|nr:adaptor protein MecA [Lachnospiraceae bacterium]